MTSSRALMAAAFAALSFPAPAAQTAQPDLVHKEWPSSWITCAVGAPRGPGVYHFRKILRLDAAPSRYVIRVSADNRFLLFVNGARAGEGPARGDLDHWRFETFDIAPLLHAGDNILAAVVWNCGALAPAAQMSDQTGFLVQGETPAESAADTDRSWQAEEEKGQGFLPIDPADVPNYYAAAPGEVLDAARYDWGWQTSTAPWPAAITVGTGEPGRYPKPSPYGGGSGINRWFLVPDPLPPMEYSETTAGRIVRAEGVDAPAGMPARVPAHARASLLFDRGTMTTGYPELVVSGGKGSTVRITYAEALVDANGKKGNRNEIEGRHMIGLRDTFLGDGGQARAWSPLWWRAWRYLQVDVETGDEAVSIDSLGVRYSGYPFRQRGAFEANDPVLARIFEVGARTARMNAHETYMDCPYWEQLQYIGDTRIQALISYTAFGDDRLARQALDAYDNSRIADGLSQARYPSSLNQVIPTFSLFWIGMLHDYWMYRPDAGPLAVWVPHTRSVLGWYAQYVRADGLLGKMPWWNFGDWTRDFVFGVPPEDGDGGSALLSLYYVAALRDAADLESSLGNAAIAADYRKRAEATGEAVRRLCWDDAHALLADTPAHAHFSEQTNTMGVLTDAIPADRQGAVMRAVLGHSPPAPVPPPGEFSPASVYFRFYVARALDHAGMDDLYLDSLGPWKGMLDIGLSTFAETAEPTRSDDHAWSAHPDYDLLTLVAGIRPASPGFATVLVAPNPGSLTSIRAVMPHPAGDITVHYEKTGQGWVFDITLPAGLSGAFRFDGRSQALVPGPNHLDFRR